MILVNIGCGSRFDPRWINLDGDPRDDRIERYYCGERLRFKDGSVDAIYSSHVIEHLPPKIARRFVQESFRVLRPNGVLRLVTPDLEKLAFEYLKNLNQACEGDLGARDRHEWLVIELFDQFSREKPGGLMLDYWKRNPMPCEDYVLERMGEEVKNFLNAFRPTMSKDRVNETDHELSAADDVGPQTVTFEKHRWLYDRVSLARLLTEVGFREIDVVAHNVSKIDDFESYRLDSLEDGRVRKPDSLFMEGVKPA